MLVEYKSIVVFDDKQEVSSINQHSHPLTSIDTDRNEFRVIQIAENRIVVNHSFARASVSPAPNGHHLISVTPHFTVYEHC